MYPSEIKYKTIYIKTYTRQDPVYTSVVAYLPVM